MNPLTTLAIFLGSALLFCLQPMVGRTLLPAFGGSAAVWSVCLATFQVLLVGGYAYAHALNGMTAHKQRRTHLTALILAVLWAFAIALAGLAWARASLHAGATPALEVLLVVLLGVGVPYLVLSAGSSLLQLWVGGQGRAVYRLYAVSNFGSFIGLFAYPFLLEPFVSLHKQWLGWSVGLAVYLALVAGIALQKHRASVVAQTASLLDLKQAGSLRYAPPDALDAALTEKPISLPRPLTASAWWYILPAISSFMLVSTTNHLSMDVTPVPLLWAVLLGAFLLSYVVGFSRLGERLLVVWRILAPAALIWSGYAAQNQGSEGFLSSVGAGVAFVFLGGTFLHSWLYSIRPESARLTHFYLGVAVGGAIGGMLVSFVAPLVFSGVWEYPVALFACAAAGLFFAVCTWQRQIDPNWFASLVCAAAGAVLLLIGGIWPLSEYTGVLGGFSSSQAIRVVWTCVTVLLLFVCVTAGLFLVVRRRRPQTVARVLNMLAALACMYACLLTWAAVRGQGVGVILRERNFYGSLKVTASTQMAFDEVARVHMLTNGGTLHGQQVHDVRGDIGRFADMPTTYYGSLAGGLALSFTPKWQGGEAVQQPLELRKLSEVQRPQGRPMRVAAIGLGAGTMAAWGRKGDEWNFFEINPLVDKVARDRRFFTYVTDSPATVNTKLGDARLTLERERAEHAPLYDVLIVDAYTGDSVPLHLATAEAFRLYADRLAPDGVLAIHISNWHMDLLPLCKAAARALNMHAVGVLTEGDDNLLTEGALWVYLTRTPVEVNATGSGADLVDFSQVRDIRLPTDDWGSLQSLIRFNGTTPLQSTSDDDQ